jgi:hypothetical protein
VVPIEEGRFGRGEVEGVIFGVARAEKSDGEGAIVFELGESVEDNAELEEEPEAGMGARMAATAEDEKGVATRVDLELVPLTEDIGDMILSLGGLPLGPDVLARELVALGLAGVRESPDDRGSSVLDVRAGRSLGEL